MPFYYSSHANNTPNERHISLSLKDLDVSAASEVKCDENFPANKTPDQKSAAVNDNNLHNSYYAVDQDERKYQQNVNILFHKSSGSKYEEMIKKFLERRGDIEGNDTVGLNTEESTPRGNYSRTTRSNKSSDNISLVESSNNLAERAAARQSRSAIMRRSQQQAAAAMNQEAMTEVLSQPLERNKYVPPDRSGTPTNLRGRQRAPPSHTSEKKLNTTNRSSSRGNLNNATLADGGGGARSVSVSIEDFNAWIENNKSWQEKVAAKKANSLLQQELLVGARLHSPSLSASVNAHAEKSYARKHSHSRGRSPSPRPYSSSVTSSQSLNPDTRSREEVNCSEGQRSMQLGELDDSQSHDIPDSEESQDVPYEKDVFTRLYDEGKRYNDFNDTMEMHRSSGRFISREMSFSPRINSKSSAIVAKRNSHISAIFRSCSPSSYRMSDISAEERREHAVQAHKHRVRSVSPANQRRLARESATLRGSTLSKSYMSTKGGKLYPETVAASILSEGKVRDVLNSSRNKSKQNAAAINQERRRGSVSHEEEILSDGGRIYEPRMVSKESKRINSRGDNKVSFEDRMLKSMDEHRIKVKVNKAATASSPGPGQYSNTGESNRCCPLPGRNIAASASSDGRGTGGCTMRSKSPGSSSYSFGRARRDLS